MDYRTDSEAITNRFPSLENIVKCYWKADIIGRANFGPTSYWMKGFIEPDRDEVANIRTRYEWISASLEFVNGISPTITGCYEFDWKYSKEFSDDIKGASFIGEFYYDSKNGLLYFDLESN